MFSKFDLASLGAHCFTAYMFPEKQTEVLISAGLNFIPRILDKSLDYFNRTFNLKRTTYYNLCYASAIINMTSLYKASNICSGLSLLHSVQSTNVSYFVEWSHFLSSHMHYVNATAIQFRLISETACVAGAGVLYPMVKIYIKPIRDFFSKFDNSELLIETIRDINESIRDNRAFTLSYDNYVLYSTPNVHDTISESDLNLVAPLRFPGNNNSDRPLEQQTEYSVPESCTICTEDYSEKQLTRTLPCKHSFHAYCVDDWLLRRSAICPICREKVFVYNASSTSIDL